MRIKAEYKDRVVTVKGAFMDVSKTLGEMTQAELKQLERLGYPLEGLCEPKKERKTIAYKAVEEPKSDDGE